MNSLVRDYSGIKYDRKDYNQVAIVGTLTLHDVNFCILILKILH